MKRKLIINKKLVLVLVVILIIVSFLIAISNLFFNQGRSKHEWGDLELAKDIQTAITSYIILSNDKKLTLGKESTASVDEILVKLQKDIIIDNENYGYILIPRKNPPEASSYYPEWDITYNGKNFGWKIEVSQETGKVLVKPYKENKVVLIH